MDTTGLTPLLQIEPNGIFFPDMKPMTFDQVLTCVENLPPDEQEMLAKLLAKRQVEQWRDETATEAREAASAYRAGKLKAESVEDAIAALRSAVEEADK